MKRSAVFGFSEELALCSWFKKGTRRKVSLVAKAVFFSLILQLCIITGFPAIGFGGPITADFSMSTAEGPAPLSVAFTDKSKSTA